MLSQEATPLCQACYIGNTILAKTLLEKGANIYTQNKGGWGPLHWAALGGHSDCIMLLLEKGAHHKAKDNYGKTAANIATEQNKHDVANLIEQKSQQLKQAKQQLVEQQSLLIEQLIQRIERLEQQVQQLQNNTPQATEDNQSSNKTVKFFQSA